MVLRNVAKTFSLEEQRQEINEIAVDLDAVNTTLTNWNAGNWDTAYSWGDHAQAGYLVATASSYNNTNWDTAYGWGDHAQGGYLTAYQTDAQIKSSYEANADTNAFTDALLTKLNGIETSATADQTGAEIKLAYEGEANTNAFTDALLTKLNGIETGATADQTASEIKTAYESNANTNAFTDAEQTKLAGIAAGAEVNLDPGGTFSGAGTTADPAIGSIQFKNTGNTFGGDSGFLWNNTYNHLTVNGPSNSKDYTLSGGIFVQPGNGKSGLTLTSGTATDNTYINFAGGTASSAEQFAFAIGRDGTTGTGMVKIADTTVAEFDSDGIKMASTKGIKFSPYGSGNVLDSYQEGEFVPAIAAGGSSGTQLTLDTNINTLRYIKIGRMVTIFGRIKINDLNGASGILYLVDLPFSCDNTGSQQSNYNALTVTTHGVALIANATGHTFVEITPGQNYGAIFMERDNDGWASVGTSELNFTPGCYMYIHGSYYADA